MLQSSFVCYKFLQLTVTTVAATISPCIPSVQPVVTTVAAMIAPCIHHMMTLMDARMKHPA